MIFLRLVRWGIPIGLVVAGTAILVFTDIEGVGEALIAAAVCVLVANGLLRFGFGGAKDRDREEAARVYFDEHGHWPDERA
jgi:hypothetical protein